MEAAICNLFRKDETVITVNGGKFGERWGKLAQTYGLRPIEVRVDRGKAVSIEQLRTSCEAHPHAKAILFQASETSTGVAMPTEAICKLATEKNMLSVCDAITALGVVDLPMDAWGIDVLMTGSQKALMIPPGLAFIALSDRAWRSATLSDLPKFYLDLKRELKAQVKNQTAWTPATSLIQGLHEAIRLLREEGLAAIFARHHELARATRAGVKALGLKILAEDAPSNAVTGVWVPPSIADGKLIVRRMRDKYGVSIAGGQDELEGKIFRLSHFGYCGPFDITTGLSCLELVLHELGHNFQLGQGVGAALQVFAEKNSKEKRLNE